MFELEQITPLRTITITHIIKFVYSCSVRVPQARNPGTETIHGYNARGQNFLISHRPPVSIGAKQYQIEEVHCKQCI